MRNADWVVYGLSWLGALLLMAWIIGFEPGTVQYLSVAATLLALAAICAFFSGQQQRGLERALDSVRSAIVLVLCFLPIVTDFISRVMR